MNTIERNISLADKSWFRTGGIAKFYSEPTTPDQFQQSIAFAQQNKLHIFILGEGANILISDEGFDGLVIRPRLKTITHEEHNDGTVHVTAGAGVSMPDLILHCLNNEITGLEEFSGIPGTVGGSVFINLHYFEFLLEHFLIGGHIIHKTTAQLEHVPNEWFKFGYNFSTLHHHEHYLVSATFKLKKASPLEIAYARGRRQEIMRHRAARYPAQGTCGSFFRNFHDNEVSVMSNGKKMIYVAYYLDKIGVKGQLSVGDAIVSYQHANMLVNRGAATSTDIILLARRMQELVRDNFGIIPKPECLLVGFKEYPLL